MAPQCHCVQVIELLSIQAAVGEKSTRTTAIAGQKAFGPHLIAKRESRKAVPLFVNSERMPRQSD